MRRASKEEWKRRVEGYRASGLSMEKYARQERFGASTLAGWSRKLREESTNVHLTVVKAAPEGPCNDGREQAIDVYVSDTLFVRVRPGFDDALLHRIVQLLEARS